MGFSAIFGRLFVFALATLGGTYAGPSVSVFNENHYVYQNLPQEEVESGKAAELDEADYANAVHLTFCAFLRNRVYETPEDTTNCQLYDGLGREVKKYSSVQEGDRLYVVPATPNKFFVWPTVEVGFNVTLSLPGEKTIIMETLAQSPRIFRLHNFVTDEEVDALVESANELKLTRSTGGLQKGDNEDVNNKGDYTSHRTSDNSWDQTSPLAMSIKKRSFELLRMPFREARADGLQVVRYYPSQFYHSHQDWFAVGSTNDGWDFDPRSGGSNRIATVFLYLSDHTAGGETVFPNGPDMPEDPNQTEEYDRLTEKVLKPGSLERRMMKVCRSKFAVKPRKGDAILFYHQDSSGTLTEQAFHGACPVLKGEKWGANLWIWNGPVYQQGGMAKTDGMESGPNTLTFTNKGKKMGRLYGGEHSMSQIADIEPGETYTWKTSPGARFEVKELKSDRSDGVSLGKFYASKHLSSQDFVFPRRKKKKKKAHTEL